MVNKIRYKNEVYIGQRDSIQGRTPYGILQYTPRECALDGEPRDMCLDAMWIDYVRLNWNVGDRDGEDTDVNDYIDSSQRTNAVDRSC